MVPLPILGIKQLNQLLIAAEMLRLDRNQLLLEDMEGGDFRGYVGGGLSVGRQTGQTALG